MTRELKYVTRGPAGGLDAGVMTKYVRKSRHLFRKLDAWAFDAALVDTWLAAGMTELKVIDTEEHVVYTVGARNFMKFSVDIEFKDDGAQLALPRAFWITHQLEEGNDG